MDEPSINVDLLFGTVEMLDAPPRIDGNLLYPRGRSIHRDRHGNITKDETYEVGCCIENWQEMAHMFGVTKPPRKTWRDRLSGFLGTR